MFDQAPSAVAPAPLQQHPCFAVALTAMGQPPLVLDGDERVLVLQRRFRGGLRVAMLSRATLAQPHDCLQRLRAAGLGRTPIILSPDAPVPALAELGAVPLMTPATVAELDLTAPVEQRRAALHPKWRNRLKHAENGPLRVTRQAMPLDPGHWLFAAEKAQQARRGYRGWPIALTLAYGARNPGMAKLFTALDGKRPVAAMLVLRHGTGATYHIGHTDTYGRALSAHNLLLWRAAAWLAAKGHTRLEVGLIDTVASPGLARFKLGSGAQVRKMGGTWGWWPPLGRTLAPLARLDRKRM
ncbi:GNAT family N-acetyltransferase [Sedimentitalea nanhaiensis]|uniref:Acetyltransferase (GNAT) domain-containing protein n=1 Tax=Sedimentitalea nanhaiensis TaxID=999627 RepID=A0A1I7AMN2_9RHOB|nr:GNAT family N-acetyltransferase [Sedimentitalea nanhaiensis]SFT76220.1 Acetyltransferase (GNAT) domain-containing protein [Sedimentitalea nanhaiensis]